MRGFDGPLHAALITSLIATAVALRTTDDFLLQPIAEAGKAALTASPDNATITLSNGLISRTFALPAEGSFPAFATLDLELLITPSGIAKSALRSLSPEAVINLDTSQVKPPEAPSIDVAPQALCAPRHDPPPPAPNTHTCQYAIGGFQHFNASFNLPSVYSTNSYVNRSSIALRDRARAIPNSFIYASHRLVPMTKPFEWRLGSRHSGSGNAWPPLGLHLVISFNAPATAPIAHRGVTAEVHYELFDGVPAFSKWVSLRSEGAAAGEVLIQDVVVEKLAVNDDFSPINFAAAEGGTPPTGLGLIEAFTDTAHGPGCPWASHAEGTWAPQPVLQCSYSAGFAPPGSSFCHPEAEPPEVCASSGEECPHCGAAVCKCPAGKASQGLGVSIKAASLVSGGPFAGALTDMHVEAQGGHRFESFRARILFFDSFDRERRGLTARRLARVTTPHVLENPIFFHLVADSQDVASFRATADACAAVGFEMIIFSFGAGFNLESTNSSYINRIAEDVAYARSKGLEVGGYDLIDLDRGPNGYGKPNVPEKYAAIGADGKSTVDACYASGWADELEGKILNLMNATGLTMLETDGPYGGAPCSASGHAHHRGFDDSIFFQTQLQSRFFRMLRAKGVYIHAPDSYLAAGANKIMNYADPAVFGRPRKEDMLLTRQMLYDSTFKWTPTQQWSFLPLEEYATQSAAGPLASKFSPTGANIKDYREAMRMFFGYGVAPCYRGKRLYDDAASKAMVAAEVAWYKHYRATLTNDIIHVRRPDGQSIDAVLHVTPPGSSGSRRGERGILVVFNPTGKSVTAQALRVGLYYTGLASTALVVQEPPPLDNDPGNGSIRGKDSPAVAQSWLLPLSRRGYSIDLPVTVPAYSSTWYAIYDGPHARP